MNHDHFDDLIHGYALDALDEVEQAQLEQHLRVCVPCRVAARGLRAVADQLGFAVPPCAPPDDVKVALMQRLAAEGAVTDRPAPVTVESGRPRSPLGGAPIWLLAAAVCPWLAIGAILASLLVTAHAAPSYALKVAPLHGDHGEVGRLSMVSGETTAFVMLSHMPPLQPGQWLSCWLAHDGVMDHVKSFRLLPRSDDAAVMLHANRPLSSYSAVEITIESSPYPVRPAGTVLASGSL